MKIKKKLAVVALTNFGNPIVRSIVLGVGTYFAYKALDLLAEKYPHLTQELRSLMGGFNHGESFFGAGTSATSGDQFQELA